MSTKYDQCMGVLCRDKKQPQAVRWSERHAGWFCSRCLSYANKK